MKDILHCAIGEIGVHEIPGSNHNSKILEYAQTTGFEWVKTDEVPWCSLFMNWVAFSTGYQRSKSALARSWLNVGRPINKPEPGDIVIYWREKKTSFKGHVGIFMGFSMDGSRIYTLGGNQFDSVSISAYSADQLLGFRRLEKAEKLILSTAILKKGSRGKAVIDLQNALKLVFIDVGTSDGIFGPKTKRAVKSLQTRNHNLKITGVFDKKTRLYLMELINAEL